MKKLTKLFPKMANSKLLINKLSNAEENSGIIGNVTVESAHSLHITWTVPKYFSLPRNEDYCLVSSTFTFANATWYLRIHPNNAVGMFVSLIRLNSLILCHDVICKFDVQLEDGSCSKDKCEYRKNCYSTLNYNIETGMSTHVKKYYIGQIHKMPGYSRGSNIYIADETLVLMCHLLCEERTEKRQIQVQCTFPSDNTNEISGMPEFQSFLTLQPSTVQSIRFSWKIPDYHSLPDNLGYSISSPHFSFCLSTWCLKLYPNGIEDYSIIGNEDTTISLVRLNSAVPLLHEIVYTFDVALTNEDFFYHDYNKFYFNEDREIIDINIGFNDMNRSDLLIKCKGVNSAVDHVTFAAHFFYEESKVKDAAIQNMSRELEICRTHGQDLKNLFLSGIDCDLTLKVKEREFRVHKHILCARSQVFECMLTHDMNEKKCGEVRISDCDPEAIEQFLLYVYSGKVDKLNESYMLELYYVADKYNMTLLKEECRDFIKNSLSVTNICDVIILALSHTDHNLTTHLIEFFIKNSSEILPTPEWLSFKETYGDIANIFLNGGSKKSVGCVVKYLCENFKPKFV